MTCRTKLQRRQSRIRALSVVAVMLISPAVMVMSSVNVQAAPGQPVAFGKGNGGGSSGNSGGSAKGSGGGARGSGGGAKSSGGGASSSRSSGGNRGGSAKSLGSSARGSEASAKSSVGGGSSSRGNGGGDRPKAAPAPTPRAEQPRSRPADRPSDVVRNPNSKPGQSLRYNQPRDRVVTDSTNRDVTGNNTPRKSGQEPRIVRHDNNAKIDQGNEKPNLQSPNDSGLKGSKDGGANRSAKGDSRNDRGKRDLKNPVTISPRQIQKTGKFSARPTIIDQPNRKPLADPKVDVIGKLPYRSDQSKGSNRLNLRDPQSVRQPNNKTTQSFSKPLRDPKVEFASGRRRDFDHDAVRSHHGPKQLFDPVVHRARDRHSYPGWYGHGYRDRDSCNSSSGWSFSFGFSSFPSYYYYDCYRPASYWYFYDDCYPRSFFSISYNSRWDDCGYGYGFGYGYRPYYGCYRPRYSCYRPYYSNAYVTSYSYLDDADNFVGSSAYTSANAYTSPFETAEIYSPPAESFTTQSTAWERLSNGDIREARRSFENSANAFPNDGLPQIGLAITSGLLDRHEEAVTAMRQALRDDPDSLDEVPHDETMTAQIGRLLDHYNAQKKQSPGNVDALFMSAALRYLSGDQAMAYFEIDRAIDLGDADLSSANLKSLIKAALDADARRPATESPAIETPASAGSMFAPTVAPSVPDPVTPATKPAEIPF